MIAVPVESAHSAGSAVRMSIPRRSSVQVVIAGVRVGGGAPIVVQSMTNTDTADIEATVQQVQALAQAGSELVRVTVNSSEAAAAIAPIRERLDRAGLAVPLIGDFHFNGHKLLREHPGASPVLLHVGSKVLRLPSEFNASASAGHDDVTHRGAPACRPG